MIEIILFLLVGVLAARSMPASAPHSRFLDTVILDWLLPLAIAYNMSGAHWSARSVSAVLVCVAITAVDAVLVMALSPVFGSDRLARRTLLVVVPLGNTAYFGFAAVSYLLGAPALPEAMIFDQLGTAIMLSLYGGWVAGLGEGHDRRGELSRLLSFRPLWGLVAGVLLGALGVDLQSVGPIRSPGSVITGSLMPLSMLALGSRLALQGVHLDREVVVGVLIRGLAGPAVLLAVLIPVFGVRAFPESAFLQAAMPPAVAGALLAERRGLKADTAYSLCFVGIVVSCVSLPALHAVLHSVPHAGP